jgi:hypothetical protein
MMRPISTSRANGNTCGGVAEIAAPLDVLRLAATVLVVLAHATIAYTVVPLRTIVWVAYDSATSNGLEYFGYWINGFAMPLFFLIAGVSAAPACAAKGPREFIRHRARRFLRPLLFCCLTILPLGYVVWAYGLLVTERIDVSQILRMRFEPEMQKHLFGPGHLWFLEYMFLLGVIWCLLSRFCAPFSTRGSRWTARLLASPLRPLWLALPTGMISYLDSDVFIRISNTFVPDPARLLHYTAFFAVGAWISRLPDARERLLRHSGPYAALSLPLFVPLATLIQKHVAAPLAGRQLALLVALNSLVVWLTLFGMLGLAIRHFPARPAWMRYPLEASFWTYLFHLPVVGLMHVVLLPLAWPAVVKFLLTALAALIASLVSYEYLVRYSLIGEFVNGARKRSASPGRWRTELGWMAAASAILLSLGGGCWYLRGFLFHDNLYDVLPGEVYRSARLKTPKLAAAIDRLRLRSVLTVAGGSEAQGWFVEQRKLCESRGVAIYSLDLKPDRLPQGEVLRDLIDVIEHAPRPLLIEGKWGISRAGLGSAIALLLAGHAPDEALRQFDPSFGQLGGAEHTELARVVAGYGAWLVEHGRSHQKEQFLAWANNGDESDAPSVSPERDRLRVVVGSPRFPARIR